MRRLVTAAAALTLYAVAGQPALAQSMDDVVSTCAVVVEEQYNDDHDRDGDCIGAVASWLPSVGAISAGADPQIVELVIELAKLYREDPECRIAWTELPQAITNAAAAVLDEDVAEELRLIAQQISTCDYSETQAIGDVPVSPS